MNTNEALVMVSRYEWDNDTKKNKLVEKGEAMFHCFGVDYEQVENGTGNFSTAIVEWADGTISNVPVEHVRFLVTCAIRESKK